MVRREFKGVMAEVHREKLKAYWASKDEAFRQAHSDKVKKGRQLANLEMELMELNRMLVQDFSDVSDDEDDVSDTKDDKDYFVEDEAS